MIRRARPLPWARLRALAKTLIALEATGGYETVLVAAARHLSRILVQPPCGLAAVHTPIADEYRPEVCCHGR